MVSSLFKSKAFINAIGRSMAGYIRFVKRTSGVSEDPPNFIENNLPDTPLIIAMWHGQGLLLPFIRPRDDIKVAIMVAKHIDGDIVHASIEPFGMTTIRGSGAGRKGKDKGGYAALRECMKAIRDDTTIALTADIPPGPARKAGLGIVTLAKLSGRPILPCAVVTKRYLKLNTWSGFTVNLPFSKMVMAGGNQIRVPRHADADELEAARALLEEDLNETTARAYRMAGTKERGISAAGEPPAFGLKLKAYTLFTRLFQPAAPLLLSYRERRGKEEKAHIPERLGHASVKRPEGEVVWIHAASVGEATAVFHLVGRLRAERPDIRILLTTGTVTSARLARSRLPDGVIHQYIPLDAPAFMTRFFDYWKPAAVILTESEIWPNMIREARVRRVPLLLVNGRMSPRSFRRWRKQMRTANPLFSSLDLVLAQNDRYAVSFERLGSRNVIAGGNLKIDAPPPPVDKDALKDLRRAIGKRPIFLAASTHPGEDEIIADAHAALRQDFPKLLTIIVPRHPDRGTEIRAMLDGRGLKSTQRTADPVPGSAHEVYVGDTIGELGLFYALAPVAFIGGSLVPHGGQNPIEAVMHETVVLTGPEVHNFEESYAALRDADACIEVADSNDITQQVKSLLEDAEKRQAINVRAHEAVDQMRGALETTTKEVLKFLPEAQKRKKERRRAS
ncbi:MAG: DUF374 domain-containing protein [Hyphomicrobiaceae bacterium]|nr:DUF374 domain-containing protein [Hyphomicrobiaceae bacterium]